MKSLSFRLGLVFAVFVASAAMLSALEIVKYLSDFNNDGEWALYQWNKVEGTLSISPEVPPALKGKIKSKGKPGSLRIKISWPAGGGDMKFFSIVPAKSEPLPKKKVSRVSFWMKTSGSGRYIELHFLAKGEEKDGDGNLYKIGLGTMDSKVWKHYEAEIPANWPLPLEVKSLSFHDWNLTDAKAVEDTIFVSRLEAKGE